ncbi:MAG: S-layer homology domain-containing protein [Firmicutes bacterium]|nr:S-layer homology domain-containing protein [Bacillota bacterium]
MIKRTSPVLLLMFILLFFCAQKTFAYELSSPSTYQIRHSITVSNDTDTFARNIYVTVPLINEEQPVYQHILGQRYSTEPLMVFTNKEHQLFALFNIASLAPQSSKEINVDYFIENSSLKYNIDAKSLSSHDVSAVDPKYIMPEQGIESDSSDIMRYGAEFLQSGDKNLYSLAKKAFADVNLYMTYEERDDDRTGALAALQTGRGTCVDYSQLYAAVLRAMGIPARLQTGYVYEPAMHTSDPYVNIEEGYIDLSMLAHTWVEFYIPEAGWIIADPTFSYTINILGNEQKLVDWDYFANISPARRYLYFSSTANIDDIKYEYMGADITVSVQPKLYINVSYSHFNDTIGHWAAADINALYESNLLVGVSDYIFAPEQKVTRAEMAVLLHRILKPETPAYHGFSDIDANAWYAPYIANVAQGGLMVGSDGLFRPEANLTRAEMAAILCRLLALPETDDKLPFKDIDASHWAAGAVSSLYNAGLIAGYSDTVFAPDAELTRAEMAAFINRALKYRGAN